MEQVDNGWFHTLLKIVVFASTKNGSKAHLHKMKAWDSGSSAPPILIFISRWRCIVGFTSQWLWPQGKGPWTPGNHWIWGGGAAESFWLQWGREKCLVPYGNLTTLVVYSACILVSIQTEVFWLPILFLLCKMYPHICFTLTERLNAGISQLKQVLAAKFTADNQESQEELTKHIEKVVKSATSKYSLLVIQWQSWVRTVWHLFAASSSVTYIRTLRDFIVFKAW